LAQAILAQVLLHGAIVLANLQPRKKAWRW